VVCGSVSSQRPWVVRPPPLSVGVSGRFTPSDPQERPLHSVLKFGYKVSHALRAYILREFPGASRCLEAHP
jgi:hypothetical protein